MKRFVSSLLLLIMLAVTVCAFASVPAAPPPATDIAQAAGPAVDAALTAVSPSLMQWYTSNENLVLRCALLLSEILALLKIFQGNGILDTLIKGAQALIVSRQKKLEEPPIGGA